MVKKTTMAHKIAKENQDGEDVSMLRTPIQLHGKPVEQILNSIHYGTPELRSLLLDECDLIFECKVCRALFRDLPNFISHKRRYCTKSYFEDNHLAIAKIPDEKVYVIHPEEPESPELKLRQPKPKSKPSLEETISRIQSGELGHSQAFKVYSDAANALQRQKEDMKLATIRTRTIPTNSNAVFMDINMASANIHERSATTVSNPSSFSPSIGFSTLTRKARERVNSNKIQSPKKVRSRILRKDCKNSEELQKLLMKELKEIQHKVKQRTQGNDHLVKRSLGNGEIPKPKKPSAEEDTPGPQAVSTKCSKEKEGQPSNSGLNDNERHNFKSAPKTTGADAIVKFDKPTSTTFSPKISNALSGSKKNDTLAASSLSASTHKISNAVSGSKKNYSLAASVSHFSSQETSDVSHTTFIQSRGGRKSRRKSLICPKCHKIFSSPQSLSFHYKVIHSPKKTFFPCIFCPRVFYYLCGVTRHLKINHAKTSSEIDALRKQLRAKAYTKIVPEERESNDQKHATGLRKSLRHKQDAFSNETFPSSSYVLHSVKKEGKKSSAEKDALRKPQSKEQHREPNSANEKESVTNTSSSSFTDVKISNDSTESRHPIQGHKNVFPHDSKPSVNSMRYRTRRRDVKNSPSSSKSISSRPNLIMHSCKKCHRLFGRILTFKNHIKVCQGRTKISGRRNRRGRSQKNISQISVDDSTIATRSRRRFGKEKRVVTLPNSHNDSNNSTSTETHTQSNRSSCRDSNKLGRLRSRLEDSVTESPATQRQNRNASPKPDMAEKLSASLPQLRSSDKSIIIKSEIFSGQTTKIQTFQDNLSSVTKKDSVIMSGLNDDKPATSKSQSDSHYDLTDNNQSAAQHQEKPNSDGVSCCKPYIETSFSQTKEENELEISDVHKKGEKVDNKIHNKSLRSMKDIAPICDDLIPRARPNPPDLSREKRAHSVERDSRSRISHLVPRSMVDNPSAENKAISLSATPMSISPPQERPRRKRKVPTRNIEAMEMLSKIHNPDVSMPKKHLVSNEGDIVRKRPRGRPASDLKQNSNLRQQTPDIKGEIGPEKEEVLIEEEDLKVGRLTKTRSRMFSLGRSNTRERRLLRTYDNARVDKLIDIHNSKCLVCGEQYSQIYNLRRHVIRIHLQWSRYQCKLCRYASFDRSECTTHIVRNHRRIVNIEDAEAVNGHITDLAKQGSKAMNRKKNQTLRDKNRRQTKEDNIYARPNVRRMPRLAERTLDKERAHSSSQEQQMSNVSGSSEPGPKTLRHSIKAEIVASGTSEVSARRNSLPFNISTRSSPRIFDTRPLKSSNSDAQGDVDLVVLHTRKGSYTKTLPHIPLRDKSGLDTKETDKCEEQFHTGKKEIQVNEKAADDIELCDNINSLEDKDVSEKLKFPVNHLNNALEKSPSREKQSCEVKFEPSLSIDDSVGEDKTMELNSQSLEQIQNVQAFNKSDVHEMDAPSPGPLQSLESKSAKNFKEVNNTIIVEIDDFHQPEPNVSSSSLDAKLSVPSSNVSQSPKTIKISPSYVLIEPSRLPPTIHVSSSICGATKSLTFSSTTLSNAVEEEKVLSSTSISLTNNVAHETPPKRTLLDEIDDDGNIPTSSGDSLLSE